MSSSLVVTSEAVKICVSHLTCKVENKCLNVHEQVVVVKKNKDGPLLLSLLSVNW